MAALDNDRQQTLYSLDRGQDALARQTELAKAYWVCCGEHRLSGHHEACARYTPPPADEGQLTLT